MLNTQSASANTSVNPIVPLHLEELEGRVRDWINQPATYNNSASTTFAHLILNLDSFNSRVIRNHVEKWGYLKKKAVENKYRAALAAWGLIPDLIRQSLGQVGLDGRSSAYMVRAKQDLLASIAKTEYVVQKLLLQLSNQRGELANQSPENEISVLSQDNEDICRKNQDLERSISESNKKLKSERGMIKLLRRELKNSLDLTRDLQEKFNEQRNVIENLRQKLNSPRTVEESLQEGSTGSLTINLNIQSPSAYTNVNDIVPLYSEELEGRVRHWINHPATYDESASITLAHLVRYFGLVDRRIVSSYVERLGDEREKAVKAQYRDELAAMDLMPQLFGNSLNQAGLEGLLFVYEDRAKKKMHTSIAETRDVVEKLLSQIREVGEELAEPSQNNKISVLRQDNEEICRKNEHLKRCISDINEELDRERKLIVDLEQDLKNSLDLKRDLEKKLGEQRDEIENLR